MPFETYRPVDIGLVLLTIKMQISEIPGGQFIDQIFLEYLAKVSIAQTAHKSLGFIAKLRDYSKKGIEFLGIPPTKYIFSLPGS